MRILITGGTGFVGSNLAKELINQNHKLTVVDNFFTSDAKNISEFINKVNFIKLDLSDESCIEKMDNLLQDIDVCYHLAASVGVKLITENSESSLQNSFKINNNLFPLFEKHQTKVIFSSTSEIYGETTKESGSEETDVLKILAPGKPRGSYACSKLMSEFLIKSYTFPSVIIRFFNIVGKGQVSNYGHVLPKFIECAKENKPLPIYGDGQQIRSYCDIRDAVQMLILLLDEKHNGQIYNIGNDKNKFTVFELAQNVIKTLESKSDVMIIPFEQALGKQFEEIYIRFPNTNKIKQYYECKYTLTDIIESLK